MGNCHANKSNNMPAKHSKNRSTVLNYWIPNIQRLFLHIFILLLLAELIYFFVTYIYKTATGFCAHVNFGGNFQDGTRERYIREIRHSVPGCSEIWILRVFSSLVKRPSPYNKVFYSDVTNKIDNFTCVIIHDNLVCY